jgi:hypothetical protein
MQSDNARVEPVDRMGAASGREADSPYVLSPQELRDLQEVIVELKGDSGEGGRAKHIGVDGLPGEESTSGNLSKLTHAVAANEVREAAARAAQAGRFDLARELEHLAEMIESGQITLG